VRKSVSRFCQDLLELKGKELIASLERQSGSDASTEARARGDSRYRPI
jgi:hypothetical protein